MTRQYTANFLHWLATCPDLHRGAAMIRREEMKLWPEWSLEWRRQVEALREHEKMANG